MLSGGILSDFDRMTMRRQVESFIGTSHVEVHVPERSACYAPNCGLDELTGSAKNIACPVCEGTGYVTAWGRAILDARVAWGGFGVSPQTYQGFTTGDVGDVQIEAALAYRGILERVRDTDGSYLVVDGVRLGVVSVITNRVEAPTSVDVRCKIVK